jgi:hypothetical protein
MALLAKIVLFAFVLPVVAGVVVLGIFVVGLVAGRRRARREIVDEMQTALQAQMGKLEIACVDEAELIPVEHMPPEIAASTQPVIIQRGDIVDIMSSPTEVGVVTASYEQIAFVQLVNLRQSPSGYWVFATKSPPMPYAHQQLRVIQRDFKIAADN